MPFVSVDDWPESVGGWDLARHDHIENYRKRLANNVTVFAVWDNKSGKGSVNAKVESPGIGRTLTSSRTDFGDKTAFWTAARCIVDMAANLPSLGTGSESPAASAIASEVAGEVEAEPGSNGTPEAELTFTLVDGRSVTLIMSDEQAFDLCTRIYRLDKHVWSEQRDDEDGDFGDEDGDFEDEDGDFEDKDSDGGDDFEDGADFDDGGHGDGHDGEDGADDAGSGAVPDVGDVQAGPDTGHDLVTLLGDRFGVTEDFLMSHIDWSALIVVGEPAVSSLIERGDELVAAVRPRWYPVVLDRPGEQWVVLRRTGMLY
ncbi:hypothetical protein AB8O38_01535 [Saccharomonospora xinjiangensis]|uniref:hypothetical protein n=1 Tax=Saccharomonospora xinjiangensis TaxID=75294 RepID=UPI0035101799